MNKKSHEKIALLLHSAIVLVISYLVVSLIMGSIHSLALFSVVEEGELPMSDMYMFINSKRNPAKLNTDITLVDIDACKDRSEIALLIEQIDSLQPKVIGLDVFFRNRKEPNEDSVLENAINRCKNIVVACEIDEDHEVKDAYSICHHNFFVTPEKNNFIAGFINLDSHGGSSVRTFTPKLFPPEKQSLDTLYSFAVQTAKFCNETAFQKLLQRPGNSELINYQPIRFYEIDKNEISDNTKWITGKIVLLGSLSEDDVHKTPINPQMQMHGVEIHAYIISTIFEGKYINRLDNIGTKIINILICYLFTMLCWYAATRLHKGVHILIKFSEVAIIFLAFFAGYFLFNRYHIVITYSKAIIVMGIVFLIVELYHIGIEFGENCIHKFKNRRHEKGNC